MLDRSKQTDRTQVLNFDQVDRLRAVLDTPLPIHGRGDVPTLKIRPRDLVRAVRDRLRRDGVRIRDIRLNGGAASYVLGGMHDDQRAADCHEPSAYNDLDLIFRIRLSGPDDIARVKDAVLSTLPAFLPSDDDTHRTGHEPIGNYYVHKLVKIFNEQGDRWSLISLSNVRGRSVELKFADVMRRQFQFSVDSFQIILDSLLTFYDAAASSSPVSAPMTQHFYPTVLAESLYGRISVALDHLRRKLIVTRRPEEIRGGGLLKYCSLLVRGYRPLADSDVGRLERYMCSRFFIDFPEISTQRVTLDNYLAEHFVAASDRHRRVAYLATLGAVIQSSTVCLMGHDRQLTLMLIRQMALRVLAEQQTPVSTWSHHSMRAQQSVDCLTSKSTPIELKLFGTDGRELVVERICYGPFTMPTSGDSLPQHFYTVYTYQVPTHVTSSPTVISSARPYFCSTSSSSSCCCCALDAEPVDRTDTLLPVADQTGQW